MTNRKPLDGIRILELGNIVAAPFAGKILSEFGAEVIKVEEPTKGDPLRNWRVMDKETSVGGYVQGRNKKSITVNLREKEGQDIVRKLVKKVDVVLENFKPGYAGKMGTWFRGVTKN